jgi:hypothetical protein
VARERLAQARRALRQSKASEADELVGAENLVKPDETP